MSDQNSKALQLAALLEEEGYLPVQDALELVAHVRRLDEENKQLRAQIAQGGEPIGFVRQWTATVLKDREFYKGQEHTNTKIFAKPTRDFTVAIYTEPQQAPVPNDAFGLLRIWQTWLGSSRDSCDETGIKLWDRIDKVLAAAKA